MLSLRPYQEQAADFLYAHDRAMMLAPVGAGKTATALTAARDLIVQEGIGRALVVAPLRVATHVWPVEVTKWAPELTVAAACGTPAQRRAALESLADIVTINYENLEWLAGQDTRFDLVIFDELTRLKNSGGKRFRAAEKLAAPMRWGLTGSFTSNGLEDVFGQCKIIDPKLLGRSKGAFQQQYFASVLKGSYVEHTPLPGALEQVMARIKPATYVLEPGDYRDRLPPLHTVEVPVEMNLTAYEKMRRDFVLELGNDDRAIAENAAAVTTKLQQLAGGFIYYNMPDVHWQSDHKLDALLDLLEENQRAPTIVWYQFVAERETLQRRIKGAVDVRSPGAIDAWNRGEVEVLLAHPASAGHGLNLQHGGCRMVWYSLPWSLELFEQAVGRLHRSGQREDVWCYVLLTTGTVDGKIWQALRDKRSLAEIAMEALKC
jgi:SNF2 family DNA or RNA helicase